MDGRAEVYRDSGVDTAEADKGLRHIVRRVQATWPRHGMGRVVLPIGYFANVVEMDGTGIALCTDGVGSKTIIATMMGKYDTIGIDCVAMNVNDMICVGARPLSLVDYIAIDQADAAMLDAIGAGLCDGAHMAGVSISGGETAQLKDIVTGFDLVGMAIGRVDLDKVICGSDVRPGDIVIGVRSSGIHSNGLSLARRAFFEDQKFSIDHEFDELGTTLGEELLRPTDIYVAEAMEILDNVGGVKALINITSDGLLNLAASEMYEVFNMGIGFCYVVTPASADLVLSILAKHGRLAQKIGHAVADPDKKVRIPQRGLIGRHKSFRAA